MEFSQNKSVENFHENGHVKVNWETRIAMVLRPSSFVVRRAPSVNIFFSITT